MDMMNINYYIPSVMGLNKKIAFVDSAIIKLSVAMTDSDIYYTADGSEPTMESTLYRKPIVIKNNCEIKAIACKGGRASGLAKSTVEKQNYRKAYLISPKKGKFKEMGY